MTFDLFNLVWPWMGLGGAVVLLFILFGTDVLGTRWHDLRWLAWLAVPVYLLHQFEEYAMNMVNGTYIIVETFYSKSSPFAAFLETMELPLLHFPLINTVFVWIAVPMAAYLYKKNPIIGLSPYGFILANGILHCVGSIVMGLGIVNNPGFFTGTLIFIPLTIWVIYICKKSNRMTTKGIIIALISGFLGHIGLGSCYAFAIAGFPNLVLIADIVVSFIPIIAAWILCKIFKIEFSC